MMNEIAALHMRRRTAWLQAAFCLVIVSHSALPANTQHTRCDTLAIIGRKAITTDRFAHAFKERVLKIGLSDNGETREGYLRNLVEDELLIARAKELRLDRTNEAQREHTRIRTQELLNAYADRHIAANVEVAEGDSRELFRMMNTTVKVRHLYARTRDGADSIHAAITRGRSFEDLARETFADPHLRENGGSLGYVSFDEMDAAFERVAFALKPGEVSRPVKTVYGYSIIKVDDIQRNPFVTESEFAGAKERIRAFVKKRKTEEAASQLVADLRAKLAIRFNRDLVLRLYESMLEMPPHHLAENRWSGAELRKRVMSSKAGAWTTQDVLDALSETTEGQKRWIHSSEDLEDFLAGLLVRRHIVRQAEKEHLDDLPEFHERVERVFDTFVLTMLEGQMRKQIRISPDSVATYYQLNKDRFTTGREIRLSGILLDSEQAGDTVRQLLAHGADFDDLARRFSVQRATAARGGDMGYFRADQLGSLGAQLMMLRTGEWKGPLVQEGKCLFVKCIGLKEPTLRSLQESSKEIEGILAALAWQATRSRYVESVKTTIPCRTFPEKLMAISLTN